MKDDLISRQKAQEAIYKSLDIKLGIDKVAAVDALNDVPKASKYVNPFTFFLNLFSFQLSVMNEELEAENELAAVSNYAFVRALRPVAGELSELSYRTYISYLAEAKEMILSGKEMSAVLYHFDKLLQECELCSK